MIIQELYLKNYDWNVIVFYNLSSNYLNYVNDILKDMNCPNKEIHNISSLFKHKSYNKGFTFTNANIKSSIIIIGKTTSADEFQNTFDHEKGHLAMHICEYCNIEPFSEEYQYLTGDIGKQMFEVAKVFMCDNCRLKHM